MHALQAAATALQNGNVPAARSLLDEILKSSPQDSQALQLMGVVHRRMGAFIQATEYFRQSLRANPAQPGTLNNLGITLVELGKDEEAEQCYRQASELAPQFADAHYNLGLLLSNRKQWESARVCLQNATVLKPANGRAFEALGNALRELGEGEASLVAAQKAVDLMPDSYTANHNLGQAYMALGDFKLAAESYERAISIKPAGDVSWIGLGHAYRGSGRANDSKSAYEKAVELNPGNPDAHRLLNEMIWQTGDAVRYLQSFNVTLQQRPTDNRLRLTYAKELLKIMQFDQAAMQLHILLNATTENGDVLDSLARANSGLGDFDTANLFHARALKSDSDNPLMYSNYAETLLKAKHHHRAHEITSLGLKRFPFAQGILALHSTAQRLVGDDDYGRLANFDGLAKVMRLEPPLDYPDIETFCTDLSIFLDALHTTKAHPTDQTLRGGTQTFGALFQNQAPILQQFVLQLRKAISNFISEMPEDKSHPLFQRAKPEFNFSGSWSVRLSSGGFHTNHFHPMGWISSAFYVGLPDAVSAKGKHDGWLKMGETYLNLGDREVIHRLIQPKIGSLVLFPSYFWHGTVPFESSSPRLTIAFDVIPK